MTQSSHIQSLIGPVTNLVERRHTRAHRVKLKLLMKYISFQGSDESGAYATTSNSHQINKTQQTVQVSLY